MGVWNLPRFRTPRYLPHTLSLIFKPSGKWLPNSKISIILPLPGTRRGPPSETGTFPPKCQLVHKLFNIRTKGKRALKRNTRKAKGKKTERIYTSVGYLWKLFAETLLTDVSTYATDDEAFRNSNYFRPFFLSFHFFLLGNVRGFFFFFIIFRGFPSFLFNNFFGVLCLKSENRNATYTGI